MAILSERHASAHPRIGPYLLARPLTGASLAPRWLALHEADQTSHVAYGLSVCKRNEDKSRFVTATERPFALDNIHILKVEDVVWDSTNRPWVITPYTGDADGVRTLARLLREKHGQMEPLEAERAIEQVLDAVEYAHAARVRHGPIRLEEVLVDRRGCLIIELYGIARVLRGESEWGAELIRDEVRSVVQIGYQLITGLRAEDPLIPAGRLVKRLDPRWESWLHDGLDAAGGFDTAAQAISCLPSRREDEEQRRPMVAVRGVLERFRATRD